MTISHRLNQYLSDQNVDYQVLPHFHSESSLGTAITANVELKHLAKAVILEDHQGRNIMAVLPASNKVNLVALNEALNANYHLAKEQDVYDMFVDCAEGAVPPAGEAYHLNTVCDQQLDHLDYVYIEAGDHETLLRLDREDYQKIMRSVKHMNFSQRVYH